jgi:peptide chain release factor 2
LASSGGIFDVARKTEKLEELNYQMSDPAFWGDADKAQTVMQERANLEKVLTFFKELSGKLADCGALLELGAEMGEEAVADDLKAGLAEADAVLEKMQLERMLSGPTDRNNAIVTIAAGAGGTESQDWAHMLYRMYLRFCEKKGWKTEVLDYQDGEEAGIKGATFHVTGEFAFGYLRPETGVHRLVRISPFDSQARRHTSFASVGVLPELDDAIEVDIKEADLRIDTYRASGSGGQHVNRTDSAVRITHIPTNTVVQCQSERSQLKNRSTAMKMLRSRLYEEEQRKREAINAALYADKADVGWGSQIRSYVLAPYQMVKDLRTQHETSNTGGVLDGDIQPFIDTYLLQFANAMAARKGIAVAPSDEAY